MSEKVVVSQKSYVFLKMSLEDRIDVFLDDPDGIFGNTDSACRDMAVHVEELSVVAQDCGMDFWQIAKVKGTEYEVNRLVRFLKRAGAKLPQEFSRE